MQQSGGLQALGLAQSDPVEVGWRCRPFAPELEAEFVKATAPTTIRGMQAGLINAAMVGILTLWGASLSGPATLRATLILELLVNLPIAAAGVLFLRGATLTRGRERVFVACVIVRVVCTVVEGHSASTALADRYVMAAGLALFCMAAMIPWRLCRCMAFIAVAYPIYCLLVLLPFDAMARNGWDILAYVGLVMPAALRVRARTEREERISFLMGVRDQARVQELARANERLHVMSDTDPLTGVGNRRTFDRTLRQGAESGLAVGLLLIDADYFKRFNDSQGHLRGDECLRQVARTIQNLVRAPDHVARFGGEEFAVVLHGVDAEEAVEVAERIRSGVEALMLSHHARPDAPRVVTVSIGVTVVAGRVVKSQEEMTAEADEALYAAKDAGRNCVRCYGISAMADARLLVG